MKTVLFALLLISPITLWAQVFKVSPDDLQRNQSYLVMRDGTIVHGRVIRQDSTIITVRKRNGDNSFIEADQVLRILPNHAAVNDLVSNAPSPQTTVFVFRDGTQVEGSFVRRDSTMITVRKRNGQLTYFEPELLVRVDTMRATSELALQNNATKPQFANRFSPWLLTGQTAYNAEKGKLYYRNTLLLLNEFGYGVTRNWSIGATVNPFFAQILTDNSARQTVLGATVNFNTKVTFPIGEQFRFGVNAIYQPKQKVYYGYLLEQIVLQGLMSFGTSQRNATLGYGTRIYTGSVYSGYGGRGSQPFISAGVMHKVSRNLTVLSDNTFYLNSYASATAANLSLALRFDRRRHAFDLGAFSTIQPYIYYTNQLTVPKTDVYVYPYLAYNLLIGR